jgi:Tfp pilus assembly protein PilO
MAETQQQNRRQLIRYDPTVSMGLLIQMTVLMLGAVVAYGKYTADQTTRDLEVAQVKKATEEDRAASKAALTELRTDMKEVSRAVGAMSESLAVIKAVQQQRPPTKP